MQRTVNLSELATIVGDDIRRTLPAERTIEYVVQPGLGARGDARLLRVVLHNLVENAVTFTRPSAKARITVGSKGPDTDPAFFVADNGIGFDMRHAATPWRDALLMLAPALVQCRAAHPDAWHEKVRSTPRHPGLTALPDSCYMWRRGGALERIRERLGAGKGGR